MNSKIKTMIVALLFVSFLGVQTVSANEDNSEPSEERLVYQRFQVDRLI